MLQQIRTESRRRRKLPRGARSRPIPVDDPRFPDEPPNRISPQVADLRHRDLRGSGRGPQDQLFPPGDGHEEEVSGLAGHRRSRRRTSD